MLLKAAVEESFDVLGKPGKMVLLKVLKKRGIDLDYIDRNYSSDIIKQAIEEAFDRNTADLILIRINQVLKKHGTNTFTSQTFMQHDAGNQRSNPSDEEILIGNFFGRGILTNNDEQDKDILSLTLTSKQVNYLYSAVSNIIADIENLDDARVKFGNRGEYYINELQENLPALQEMLFEMLAKGRKG